MTWREDKVEKSKENLIIQAYEGKNNPGSESEMVIQEDSVPQGDGCHNQNEDTSSTNTTRRLRKLPVTRRDDFLWMGESKI
jgi:hypothetical protein